MNKKTVLIILFLIIMANTHAETIKDNTSPLPEKTSQEKIVLDVKFMKQGHMGCSRTSFATVMHYYDPAITLETVEREAPRAPDGGSENHLMAVLANQYGFTTHAFPGTIDGLITLLKSGKPVIVAQYPTLTDKKSNHDRVVVGFDRGEGVLLVHDPSVGANIPYGYDKFLSLWESNVGLDDKYYAVLVTPTHIQPGESRNISVDGMDEDWAGMEAFSPDRTDDTSKGDLHLNIRDVYCFKDNSFVYLKTNFIKSPKTEAHIIHFFNIFIHKEGKTGVHQFNFRFTHNPWIQLDAENYEPMKNVEWKLGDVFEARVGLENFKNLPDVVSIQAGIYDTKRKKFIDMSYPNALKISK